MDSSKLVEPGGAERNPTKVSGGFWRESRKAGGGVTLPKNEGRDHKKIIEKKALGGKRGDEKGIKQECGEREGNNNNYYEIKYIV